MEVEPAAPLSRRRRLTYGLIVACVSVMLFLGLLEGGLRLVGYGHPTQYYRVIEDDGGEWIRENRDFVAPYFSPELVRRPQAMRLSADKAGAYRIFVLGSSAAMGDPEASFSMSRLLETMLREAYPQLRFEVVNAAITAVNSHVVRQVAADLAELQPDLFIVYEGNNEVIGPFGPAAVFTPFLESAPTIRAVTWLRGTRTGQLLGLLAHRLGRDRSRLEQWGGMQMFLDQQFTNDDPRLDRVAALFAGNLRSIVESAEDAGAHTLLCTVLTNQRDFAPFLSAHAPGLSPEDLARWDAAVASGDQSLALGDSAAALQSYRQAAEIDAGHAALQFRIGRAQLATDRVEEARATLQRALDLDTLRFRTDSRLNTAIREVAAGEPDAATLVDLAALAAGRSQFGILGDDFLYEHVHLSFWGTFNVAGELFTQVSAELARRGRVETTVRQPLTYDDLRLRMAYTPYDQAMIIHELFDRFTHPPFTGQLDHAARLETWSKRVRTVDQLLARPGSHEAIIQLYERALALNPQDWMLARNFGMALVAFGEFEAGAQWLEKAAAVIDDDPDTLYALATAQRGAGNSDEAAATFARLRKLEPKYPGLPEGE